MKSFPIQLAATFGLVAAAAIPGSPSLAQFAPAVANVASASIIGGQAAQPAAKTPVAEWTFAEGTGTTTADVSGHNNVGTLVGNPQWTTGIIGPHALHFTGQLPDGSGSFVDIPKPVVDTSRSFSVSTWVKMNGPYHGGYQTFVSIDGTSVSGFFLQLRSDGLIGLAILPTDDNNSNTPAVAAATAPPEPGIWYHVVGVYDAAAQTLALYINGAAQGTVTFTTPWKADGHTVIGRGKFAGKPVDFADAEIDDVRFYDSALSTDDISALTRQGMGAPTLKIDAAVPAAKVSPTLYGLMTEEINYAYDGGIYGELIHNRDFKADPTMPSFWSLLQDGGATGSMALDTSQPVSDALTSSLRVTVQSAGDDARLAVANSGYWGIPMRPDTRYRASFWAKGAQGFKGNLTLSLESTDGRVVYAKSSVGKVSGDWKRYDATLKTDNKIGATPSGRFVISTDAAGTFNVTEVSLFPPTFGDRPNGNRVDLMQKLADMKPKFLRLPGGNFLEGDTVADRFDWKKTIGPIESRPGHQGPWGYRSTDGMGLLEFAEWCEDLHMEPLLAVYAGYSLHGDHIATGPALTPYVQDALDEIEYLSGDKSTKWGGQRAKDGHPAPFSLHYVEIGNEDGNDKSNSYDGRFTQYYDAIKARFPQLQLIATTPVKSRTPDVIDEHYYRTAADMEQHVHQYDGYSRTGPKIAVGEWASQIYDRPWEHPVTGQPPTPNWDCALGDAAWLTGIERNSDVVALESYAPLLVNVNNGARQWPQNLIGYDALNSFGSPSYWVQAVFGSHVGDSILHQTMTGALDLYTSVTQDSTTGVIYVKMVNTSDHAQPVKIDVHGSASIRAGQDASVITLASARPTDGNSIDEPDNILPVNSKSAGAGPTFTYTFPPRSVTVLMLGGK